MPDDPVLRKFLDAHSNHRENHPVAVFDCDGTMIRGDIGEAMLYQQIEGFHFKVSPASVWQDHPSADRLDALFTALVQVHGAPRINHPAFEPFAKMILDRYFGQIADGSVEKACGDIVRLFSGFPENDVRALARATLASEVRTPLSIRTLGGYSRPRGIRYLNETLALFRTLQEMQFDIWVVSGSNRWSVESVFIPLGIPRERIIGIELEQRNGVLDNLIVQPVPVRENKVAALMKAEPRVPLLVASDSRNDLPLFRYSAGIKVYVNSRRKESAEFFAGTTIVRDDSWAVFERPTLKE